CLALVPGLRLAGIRRSRERCDLQFAVARWRTDARYCLGGARIRRPRHGEGSATGRAVRQLAAVVREYRPAHARSRPRDERVFVWAHHGAAVGLYTRARALQ